MRHALLVMVLLALVAAPARAGYEDGIAAHLAGDYRAAFEHFRPLAEQGHALAQLRLGTAYNLGFGVPVDPVEAAYWLQKAADQNVADAQYRLGLLYEYGRGVPRSRYQAIRWWRRAAALGSPEAMHLLDDHDPFFRPW